MRSVSVIKRKPSNPVRRKTQTTLVNPSPIINDIKEEKGVEKNSAIALLKFAGAWQGNDLHDLLKEVKSIRSIIEF